MGKSLVCVAIAMLISGSGLRVQAAASIAAELKQGYQAVKANILTAAEKMPDDGYAFKATPEVRSFAEVVGHIVEAQMRTCSAVLGDHKTFEPVSKGSKADVVAGLKASFEECNKAYDALTDSNALEAITTPRGQRTRAGALVGNLSHDEEQWGIMTVYMRLKGVTPK
jgi:hypothetical protein